MSKLIDNKLLLCVGGLCLMYIWLFDYPYTLVELSGSSNGWYYPLYLAMALATFVPCLYIAKKLQNWQWMANYGTKTLGTLVLHSLMLHTCAITLNRLFVPETPMWFVCFVIAYVIVCVLCYYLTILIERYCPILLGKF